MPLNEAAGYRTRPHLNLEQRTRAEADLLGIYPMPNLNSDEIERMRSLVAQHDAQNKGSQVFDLNNPPKKPYVYNEFPRMVFHHEKGLHKVVKHAEELAAALKAGWKKEPKPVVVEAEEEAVGEQQPADSQNEAAADTKPAKSKAAKK